MTASSDSRGKETCSFFQTTGGSSPSWRDTPSLRRSNRLRVCNRKSEGIIYIWYEKNEFDGHCDLCQIWISLTFPGIFWRVIWINFASGIKPIRLNSWIIKERKMIQSKLVNCSSKVGICSRFTHLLWAKVLQRKMESQLGTTLDQFEVARVCEPWAALRRRKKKKLRPLAYCVLQ